MQLHNKYQDQGLEVITVNVEGEEGQQLALQSLQKHSVDLTNWCLVEGLSDEVTGLLKLDAVPALVFYDKQGQHYETLVGEVSHEELEQRVERLLKK